MPGPWMLRGAWEAGSMSPRPPSPHGRSPRDWKISCFNGSGSIVVNGQKIHGYTTEPNRNTITGTDWGSNDPYEDLRKAITIARKDNHHGPFMVYTSIDQYGEMEKYYTDNGAQNQTPKDRIMKSLGSVISDIKPSYFLTDECLMVEMNRETVELAVAQDITPVQWDVMGGAETRYRVLAVMVPMVKSDKLQQSGIVHISGI